jgi:hypothetical protein
MGTILSKERPVGGKSIDEPRHVRIWSETIHLTFVPRIADNFIGFVGGKVVLSASAPSGHGDTHAKKSQ